MTLPEQGAQKIAVSYFNCRLQCKNRKKKDGDPQYIGRYGLGSRNERGEILLEYLQKEQEFYVNTFLNKFT